MFPELIFSSPGVVFCVRAELGVSPTRPLVLEGAGGRQGGVAMWKMLRKDVGLGWARQPGQRCGGGGGDRTDGCWRQAQRGVRSRLFGHINQ